MSEIIEHEVIEMEKTEDGSYQMLEVDPALVTEADIDALIKELEGSVITKEESVEHFLDRMDDEREEWSRIVDDLYPEDYASGPTKPRVHKDTDRIQSYLAKERQENAE